MERQQTPDEPTTAASGTYRCTITITLKNVETSNAEGFCDAALEDICKVLDLLEAQGYDYDVENDTIDPS